jgi:hypothetical protein
MALYTLEGGCAEEGVIMLPQKLLLFITVYFHQLDVFTKILVCRYHLV